MQSWNKYGLKLAYGMLVGSFWDNMQPINFIADYYGEEFGFYFAWLVHYTGQLIFPALFGLVLFIIQWYNFTQYDGSIFEPWEAFNSTLNALYAIFISIWVVLYLESWKRTEAVIKEKWLTNDMQTEQQERPQFISVEDVDETSKSVKKVSITNEFMRKWLLAFPISLFFMTLVIITQLLIREWYLANLRKYGDADIT